MTDITDKYIDRLSEVTKDEFLPVNLYINLHGLIGDMLQEMEELQRENLQLRRGWCLAYSEMPYTDDGELQDNALPTIDFLRDSADEINDKILTRGLKIFSEAMKGKE